MVQQGSFHQRCLLTFCINCFQFRLSGTIYDHVVSYSVLQYEVGIITVVSRNEPLLLHQTPYCRWSHPKRLLDGGSDREV